MNLYVIFEINMLMKRKMILFLNVNIKIKLKFFSQNKLKFNLELLITIGLSSDGIYARSPTNSRT